MILIDASQNAQQRRLSRSVESNNSNLGAIEIREVDIFQDRLLVIELTDADHGINDFVWLSRHNLDSEITQIGRRNESMGGGTPKVSLRREANLAHRLTGGRLAPVSKVTRLTIRWTT